MYQAWKIFNYFVTILHEMYKFSLWWVGERMAALRRWVMDVEMFCVGECRGGWRDWGRVEEWEEDAEESL